MNNMIKKTNSIIQVMVFLVVILILSGCREYQIFYFKVIRVDSKNIDMEIEVIPSRSLMEIEGKKIAIESNPYGILFKFKNPIAFRFAEVKSVTLVRKNTNSMVLLSTENSGPARLENGLYWSIVSLSEQLGSKTLEFEPYELMASVCLHYENLECEYVNVKYELIPVYKFERRSDIFSAMMGI